MTQILKTARHSIVFSVAGTMVVALSLLSAPQAHAGGKYRHYDHGYHYGYDRYHYDRRSHRRHYRHKRYHRKNRDGAYLLGGLALGALITHAWHQPNRHHNRHHSDQYDHHTRTRVVHRDAPVSRRLFRDRNGNCFERIRQGGEELLVELSASECRW